MQPDLADARVRELALEILQRQPYAGWRTSGTVRLRGLFAWLDDVMRWLETLSIEQPVLYVALVVGLLLVSALLLAHVVMSLRAALRAPAAAAAESAPPAGRGFAAEAEALAAQGRFLDAARRLQLATIELLVGRGQIALSRFEANRVLRARVQHAALSAGDRRALVDLLDRLERSWFRDRAGDAELYGAWRAMHGRLRGEAP